MTLHGALPMAARIDAGILRLRADRGGIEQNFGAHQRHASAPPPGNHWSQQIATPSLANCGVEHLEAGVARREVELLVIAGSFRNVRFAVAAEHRAVGIDDDHGVVERIVGALEHADRQHHAELARQTAEMLDRRMALERLRQVEMPAAWSLQKYGVSNNS